MAFRSVLLRVCLSSLCGLAWPAVAQPPDYDALSDRHGNVVTEKHRAALIALAHAPDQLEAVYADATAGNTRAKTVWVDLELQVARAGIGIADRVTSPSCLVMVYRELSGECIPDWSFLDFLLKDRPGADRLREVIFRAFATRARERGLRNQVILSVSNGVIALGVAATILREAEVAASASKVQLPPRTAPAARAPTYDPIWSATEGKTSAENAFAHWKKHGAEFPELRTMEQYAERARRFLNEPPQGALTKVRSSGEVVVYDRVSNTFGVRAADGTPKTLFKPDPVKHHYPTNLDYFNAQ